MGRGSDYACPAGCHSYGACSSYDAPHSVKSTSWYHVMLQSFDQLALMKLKLLLLCSTSMQNLQPALFTHV